MSFLAIEWALEHSPVADPYERLILVSMAQNANSDGTSAYKSRNTLAGSALCDKSVVTRRLNTLEERGVICEGDQRAAAHIPEYKRPKVYDLLIPYSYYGAGQLAKVNAERAERGLGPLTPQDRPDLLDAPERKPRADKGTKRGVAGRKGGASSTRVLQAPPPSNGDGMSGYDPGASSTRVLEAPDPGASSTPTLSFNSVPSSSPAPSDQTAPPVQGDTLTTEEKIATPNDHTPAPAAGEPSPEAEPDPVGQIRSAWVAARVQAGFGPHRKRGAVEEFESSAAGLLAQGKPLPWLIELARWMGSTQAAWCGLDGATGAQRLGAPVEPRLPSQRPAPEGMCPRHSWAIKDDCAPCLAAERDKSEPAPVAVDFEAMRARLRRTG
ncbi:hypothetical protein KV557_24785 [Kitasatospora aureofaciens]|uniref:hypothetical protein n=1 Tax=Kitasatospora aureofaciens TaxID=1894 RepID=UPI001C490DD5|nr:hypothetical protein [Kitasatospora aureofaciens]MBV6700282.1 hypothetical protein [Kitasatospora aureofaciens]